MLYGLGCRNRRSCGVLDGRSLGGEGPRVEDGIADEVGDLAVVPVTGGLHGEVDRSGALILGWRSAGDDLELVHGVETDAVRYQAVVPLLIDGLCREAIEVKLAEIVPCSTNDRDSGAGLGAGR